ECASEEIKDCLLQKALSELSKQDDEVEQMIRDTLNAWKLGLLAQLCQAQQNGEIGAEADCDLLADYLVMGIYGLRTFAHTKPEKTLLSKMAQQLLCTLFAKLFTLLSSQSKLCHSMIALLPRRSSSWFPPDAK